jgi:hypothetical protein
VDAGSIDLSATSVETLEARTSRSPAPQAPQPTGAIGAQALASRVGNRSFAQVVARMRDGEGILDSGVVHPDVEFAIAAARGSGRPLDRSLSSTLEQGMGESLGDVRVHTGDGAAALARAVSARAFTVGPDIFFGDGEYRPGTADGDQLVAHEVAHVIQQRGAPSAGPLTVSQPGDALELEAEALARDLSG